LCNDTIANRHWNVILLMDEVEKVKAIIDKHHTKSDGSCGLPIPMLQIESEISNEELKVILRKLYEEKYFRLREGLNGKLIFKTINKTK